MSFILVAAITFLAIFTQSISGFGLGLVSMALLPAVIDLRIAVPLVTLVSLCAEAVLLLRYRQSLSLRAVARLSAASFIGIPLGLLALNNMDSAIMLRLLGSVVAGYALFGLLNLRLPAIHNPQWAYGFGLVSGVLTGLYNAGGPPVVIYGTCRRWSPDEFRSNLQGFFILNTVMLIVGHTLSHNYTSLVWEYFIAAVPAILAALVGGMLAAKYINPMMYRKIVLVVLLLLGLRLLLG